MISFLARLLARPSPRIGAALVPNGARHPLVVLGILRHLHNLRPLDRCPGCTDCEDAPMPYYASLPDGTHQLEFMCPQYIRAVRLCLWQVGDAIFDGNRFAELLSNALEAEEPRRLTDDETWDLGQSQWRIGGYSRRIVFIRRLDLARLPEGLPDGTSFLLIVGAILGDVSGLSAQLARRVFRITDVLRVGEDGSIVVLRDVLESRFAEMKVDPESATNHESSAAEKVAEYYKNAFFGLFEVRDQDGKLEYEKIVEAQSLYAKHTSRDRRNAIGLAAGTISKVLSATGSSSDPCARFWFVAATDWLVFKDVCAYFDYKQTTTLRKQSARKLFDEHNLNVYLERLKRIKA